MAEYFGRTRNSPHEQKIVPRTVSRGPACSVDSDVKIDEEAWECVSRKILIQLKHGHDAQALQSLSDFIDYTKEAPEWVTLNSPISALEGMLRLIEINALEEAEFFWVHQLFKLTRQNLRKIPNFGEDRANRIVGVIEELKKKLGVP